MEPDGNHEVEGHHRNQLGAKPQENGELGDHAEQEQDNGRDRMERMGISAPDGAQRPFPAEHHDVDAHESVLQHARQD